MNRVFEAIKRFMLKEVLLQRFEEKVAGKETATIDVFLKKGKEYIVRGKVTKGHGKPILSLVDVGGSAVENQYNDKGNNVYFTPGRDGLYRIVVATNYAVNGHESVPVEVTLAYRLPPPQYLIDSVRLLPCESDWPGFKEYESTEDLPETEATVTRGCMSS
ncbi:MAG: hypothetical protein A4E64_00996 [Syntrophorhabdus sp. PtaU1.Bin058]|nr:MAG: hypothetical protein A4E64_00996 [Syntrophorhabdus sp. PtaU1.Bin058]